MTKAASASQAGDGGCDLKRKHAGASEGSEILRLKKEALAAINARGRNLSEMKPTAATAMKKKKKVVKTKVPQTLIDRMKVRLHTVEEIPEDELAQLPQDIRDIHAGQKVVAEKIQAYQRALLDQYDAQGFAEDETEVSDEDEEEELVEAAN